MKCTQILRLIRIIGVAALVRGTFSTAGAQVRAARGVIDGLVTDTGATALANASALIVGSGVTVTTGSNGRFRISSLPAGDYILLIRRVGFSPLSIEVELAGGDTSRIAVSLSRPNVVLDTTFTVAPGMRGRLGEFEARRRQGEGQFMTREQIEKRGSAYLPDLLRTFLSVNVSPTGIATNRRMGIATPCPFQYFIDGVRIPTPIAPLTELPSPEEIAGIEVYANSATIPLQYKTAGGDASGSGSGGFCGVIVLWTRGG